MPILQAEEIHVWFARQPSTAPPDLDAILSRQECLRARCFQFAKDRFAYIFAHAVLRNVLSQYLHCPPRDIQFSENPFGKPLLDHTNCGEAPEFNLSHAGGMVLVGVSRGHRIGIDVEDIRPIEDISAIAQSYFTLREYTFIFSQPPAERERAFLSCWTRKEAYVKAVGKGLSIALDSFDTLISTGQPDALLQSRPGSPDRAIWQLVNLDLPERYVGAVAVETGIDRLVYFEWRPTK
jgi:4'-phosphopantetheinyl transferase